MELIVGSLSKPSNGSIGKVQGVTEAAIRNRQNNSPEEFEEKMQGYQDRLASLFAQSHELEKEIEKQMRRVRYEWVEKI